MNRNRSWLALAVLAVCALVLAGCAPGRRSLSDAEAYQRFVGTWVNMEYPGTLMKSQVTVIRPDYVGEDWRRPDSTRAEGQWAIKVRKTWVDEKGNTYCQFYLTRTLPASMHYSVGALMRVDKRRGVWEMCDKPTGFGRIPAEDEAAYPERIDPNLQYYYIYYRKK
jgi:hypothetical protein